MGCPSRAVDGGHFIPFFEIDCNSRQKLRIARLGPCCRLYLRVFAGEANGVNGTSIAPVICLSRGSGNRTCLQRTEAVRSRTSRTGSGRSLALALKLAQNFFT
jgi:hypothetical protein